MKIDLKIQLLVIARFYKYSHAEAKAHADEVWEKMQGEGPARLPVVNEAWSIVSGTYSYYDTARALESALRGTEL